MEKVCGHLTDTHTHTERVAVHVFRLPEVLGFFWENSLRAEKGAPSGGSRGDTTKR